MSSSEVCAESGQIVLKKKRFMQRSDNEKDQLVFDSKSTKRNMLDVMSVLTAWMIETSQCDIWPSISIVDVWLPIVWCGIDGFYK